MIRNTAGQTVYAELINLSSGADFAGTVTVYVDGDNVGQAIGTTSSGIAVLQGHGLYSYAPSAAETNYGIVAFTFTGSGAKSETISFATITAQQLQSLQTATASGAISVTDLCTAALSRINVIESNQAPPADLLKIAFDRFNDLVDNVCANERLTIYSITETTFTITNGKQTYTLGTGGDISVVRPVFIDHWTFTDSAFSPAFERPLVVLTDDAWTAIPIKTSTSPYPTYAYYNPTFTSGALGTLKLWPVPTSTTLTGNVYAPAAVTRFASLTDTIALPPGYNRFLRDNLAVELAGELGENTPVDPRLLASARESKANIKRANIRLNDMTIDAMWLGHAGARSNIYVG